MKTLLVINRENRFDISFYGKKESGKIIQLIMRNKVSDAFSNMKLKINDEFDILCIVSTSDNWNYYNKCKIVSYLPSVDALGYYLDLLIHCNKIVNNLNTNQTTKIIRKEKINNVNNLIL